MSSFTSAVALGHDQFLYWIAISAEQIEAAGGTAADQTALEGKDLGLVRAFPVPTDALDLARHVNEFLAERPAF